MMRFLRKGDCYALEKPIKKRYYLSLNSFQCLSLSLSTIYYQFSCNVQKSRARGTTGNSDGRDGSDTKRSSAVVLLTIFCVLFNFASTMEVKAQELRPGGATGIGEVKPLEIGDTIPEELWHLPLQVVNHPDGKETITLNDYRDKKLIILDFWNTGCGSCRASFGKLKELNNQFNDDVAILLCNSNYMDSREKVNTVLSKSVLNLELPSSLNSPELNTYFPHRGVPHIVWISNTGKILSTSSSSELDDINLSNYLKGVPLELKEKIDDVNFDTDIPLLVNGNGGDSKGFRYRSLFTNQINGIGQPVGQKKYKGSTRFFAFNQTILDLLKIAWPELAEMPDTRLRFDHTSIKLVEEARDSLYCYEVIVPQSEKEIVRSFIRSDIQRYTQMTVRTSTEKMDYLLVASAAIQQNKQQKFPRNDFDIKLSEAVKRLNYLSSIPIIIKENDENPMMFIEPFEKGAAVGEIIKSLEKAGLTVQKVRGDIEVLNISAI